MTTITERLARYRKLAAAQAREDAKLHANRIKALDGHEFDTSKYIQLKPIFPARKAFHSAAPAMFADLEALHGVLEVAREALENTLTHLSPMTRGQNKHYHAGKDALAAINAIMGGK
jgi:hypothetical protein